MVNFVMLLFAGLFAPANGQENTGGFMTDQNGKFVVYYQEKNIKFEDGELFKAHVNEFFKKQSPKFEKEEGQERVMVEGKTALKKHATIGNYIAGDVNYKLVFEKTADGYRYWFTDLSYQPYIKDRYGKIVPANVKPIPLEKNMSSLNQGTWNKQREYAYQTLSVLAENFNKHLSNMDQPRVVNIPH